MGSGKFTGNQCKCDDKSNFYWTVWILDMYSGPGTVKNKRRFKVHETCGGWIKREIESI